MLMLYIQIKSDITQLEMSDQCLFLSSQRLSIQSEILGPLDLWLRSLAQAFTLDRSNLNCVLSKLNSTSGVLLLFFILEAIYLLL